MDIIVKNERCSLFKNLNKKFCFFMCQKNRKNSLFISCTCEGQSIIFQISKHIIENENELSYTFSNFQSYYPHLKNVNFHYLKFFVP